MSIIPGDSIMFGEVSSHPLNSCKWIYNITQPKHKSISIIYQSALKLMLAATSWLKMFHQCFCPFPVINHEIFGIQPLQTRTDNNLVYSPVKKQIKTVSNPDKIKKTKTLKQKVEQDKCNTSPPNHWLLDLKMTNVLVLFNIPTLISSIRLITVTFLLSRNILTPRTVRLLSKKKYLFFSSLLCHTMRVTNKITSRGRQLK